ncbi:hypothetical protein TBR22_A41830 [Luteitalea sp. TBR-22]|uniref:hypothetical protein n=1 Tax=Luteitalea sp. TBR-22 TaxID=2802971 RepID=UPI001AF7ABC7|nr:hypothetical protein [Luteitalea sp. TBR-22]BCS34957.1 hypothetical protein TBR22_A41830 [Luteitalea sp. TBR-22]
MALPPIAIALAPSAPGSTPPHVRLPTGTALGAGASSGPVMVAAAPAPAPTFRQLALGWLEDAALVLMLVFAVPAVIMLFALPLILVFRLAAIPGGAQ